MCFPEGHTTAALCAPPPDHLTLLHATAPTWKSQLSPLPLCTITHSLSLKNVLTVTALMCNTPLYATAPKSNIALTALAPTCTSVLAITAPTFTLHSLPNVYLPTSAVATTEMCIFALVATAPSRSSALAAVVLTELCTCIHCFNTHTLVCWSLTLHLWFTDRGCNALQTTV